MTSSRLAPLRYRPSALTARPLLLAAGAAAVLALGREAVISPKAAVQVVAAVGLVAVTFRWPLAALSIFVVLTFPENLPGALGAGATLAKPFGVVITASWVLLLVSGRVRLFARDEPVMTALLVAFVLWATASQIWAVDSHAARSNLSRLVQGMVLLLITYSTVRRRRDVRVLAGAYLAAALATSIYALATGSTSEGGRLTGGIVNPNFFAAQLVVAMTLAGFMLPSVTGKVRLLLIAMFATFAVAFVLTQSRAGLIGAGAALGLAVLVAGPLRPRVIVAGLIVAALALGYYAEFAPKSLQQRVTQVSAEASAGRSDEWSIALRITGDHPFAGVGLGNFPVVEPSYTTTSINLLKVRYALQSLVAHNTYLEVLSELGIVGLLLLIGSLLSALRIAARSLRVLAVSRDLATSYIVRGLIAGVGGLLTAYFFASGEYEKTLWLLLGILVASASALRSEEDASALRVSSPTAYLR